MRRILPVAAALLCFAGEAIAHYLKYSGGQFSFEAERGFHRVVAEDFFSEGLPGHPELPVRYLTYILPPGVKADSVRLESCDYSFVGSYYLYPAQPSVPLDSEPPWVPPDSAIYNSELSYPAAPIEIVSRGFFDGASVVTVAVHPLTYIPARREVYVASRVEFDFFASGARPRVRPRVRHIHAQRTFDQALRSSIENRQDIPSYYRTPMLVPERAPGLLGPYPYATQYTIITNDDLASAFQPYADWLTDKGVPASVVRLSHVLHHFPGVDDAERLRNYLIDGYENHGLVWVLLGGDAGIVPFRYGWTDTLPPPPGNNSSAVAPSDLYFSDLEGNWDADGDSRWGEPLPHDSVEVCPQVLVGRLTVREPDKVGNWVYKMLHYEKNGSNDLNQFNRAYWIYDGDGGLSPYPGARAAFPPHIDTTNYNSVIAPVARDAFGRDIHNPAGICNINCHGDPMNFASKSTGGWWKVWAYNRGHENDFNAGLQYCNTTGQHYIVYDIGCYTAAFDPFVYHGSFYPSDTTMADAYTDFYSTTLGIAHLGNTRNGLWVGGGPSFSLQQAFWVLFFADPGSPSAPAPALGAAEGLSKVVYQQDYVRHAHNLFGSPELEPWVISPDRMSVQAPSLIPQGVQVQFQVQVTHGQTGIPGVRVCLHKSGDIYQVGVTNSSGIVQFVVCAETPGVILITCTYPRTWIQQYLPHQKTCTVVPAFGDGPMGEVPQELGFTAVGPSPAFSGFTVQYGVPVQGRVRLQLHDVQGRVAVVVSDEELAPGYYRQDISKWALPLPAGVYFLALAQNGNRVTRKVTLVE